MQALLLDDEGNYSECEWEVWCGRIKLRWSCDKARPIKWLTWAGWIQEPFNFLCSCYHCEAVDRFSIKLVSIQTSARGDVTAQCGSIL